MKAKLIVEGKEFDIEILDPELQKLLAPPKKTGYERVGSDDHFFCEYGGQAVRIKSCDDSNKSLYASANYYSNETIAENNVRTDKLMRQLRRFAVEHRENELDWSRRLLPKYFIRYDSGDASFFVDSGFATKIFGCIYFDTQETTQAAIDTFHDELVWYFTEYKDSL